MRAVQPLQQLEAGFPVGTGPVVGTLPGYRVVLLLRVVRTAEAVLP